MFVAGRCWVLKENNIPARGPLQSQSRFCAPPSQPGPIALLTRRGQGTRSVTCVSGRGPSMKSQKNGFRGIFSKAQARHGDDVSIQLLAFNAQGGGACGWCKGYNGRRGILGAMLYCPPPDPLASRLNHGICHFMPNVFLKHDFQPSLFSPRATRFSYDQSPHEFFTEFPSHELIRSSRAHANLFPPKRIFVRIERAIRALRWVDLGNQRFEGGRNRRRAVCHKVGSCSVRQEPVVVRAADKRYADIDSGFICKVTHVLDAPSVAMIIPRCEQPSNSPAKTCQVECPPKLLPVTAQFVIARSSCGKR